LSRISGSRFRRAGLLAGAAFGLLAATFGVARLLSEDEAGPNLEPSTTGASAAAIVDDPVQAARPTDSIDVDGGNRGVAREAFVDTEAGETKPKGNLRLRAVRDGAPVSGVVATLVAKGDADPELFSRRVATGEDGSVLVVDLPVGAVDVVRDGAAKVGAIVEKDEETEVVLDVSSGFSVIGRVVDAAGAPVPNAAVYCDDVSIYSNPPTVRCDAAGRFRLFGLPPGEKRLVARTPNFLRGFAEMRGGERCDVDVVVRCDEACGALKVAVVGPDGGPHADAELHVEVGENGGSRVVGGFRARTDAVGEFAVEGVAPGLAKIAVRGRGGAIGGAEKEVAPSEVRDVVVAIGPGRKLRGVVYAEDGRTPASGASIEAVAEDFWSVHDLTRVADAEGRFEFPEIPKWSFTLYASHPSLGRSELEVEGDADAEALTIVLRRAHMVAARVVDLTGAPIADAEIVLTDAGSDDFHWSERTQADGRATFDLSEQSVIQSAYVFACGAVGWYLCDEGEDPLARCVERRGVRPGDPEVVIAIDRIRLSPASASGRLVDMEGRPVRNVRATVETRLDTYESDPSDKDGLFSFKTLPEGPAVFFVVDDFYGATLVRSTTLRLGTSLDLGDVVLAPALRVEFDVARSKDDGPYFLPRILFPGTARTIQSQLIDGVVRFALGPGTYAPEFAVVGTSDGGPSYFVAPASLRAGGLVDFPSTADRIVVVGPAEVLRIRLPGIAAGEFLCDVVAPRSTVENRALGFAAHIGADLLWISVGATSLGPPEIVLDRSESVRLRYRIAAPLAATHLVSTFDGRPCVVPTPRPFDGTHPGPLAPKATFVFESD
jgi:hypothetical protein